MERSQALKTLRKLIGPEFGYQINSKAVGNEARETAQECLPIAKAEKDRLEKLVTERYRAVLAADAEYQSLRAQSKAATKRFQELSGITRARKITVGTSVAGMFFMVKAEGDSWEEVIGKVKGGKS